MYIYIDGKEHMMPAMKAVPIHFEKQMRKDLATVAGKLSKKEGRTVSSAELVRIAVKEYLRGRV